MEVTHVDAKGEVEGKPDNDDRSEGTANLRSSQRLDKEEKDEDSARCPYDRRFGNIRLDDFETVSDVSIAPNIW